MPLVEIDSMTFGPYGIGRLDGKAVMVPTAVAGDLAEIAIASERGTHAIGGIERIVRPSPSRRPAPCPFLPRCGGCDWQQIEYPAQVAFKGELLAGAFRRALGVALDPRGLIEPAPEEFGYRSRTRFKVGAGGAVGFHAGASHALVEVDRCLVAAGNGAAPVALATALGARCAEIETVADGDRTILIASLKRAPQAADRARARAIIARDQSIRGIVLSGGGRREIVGEARLSLEVEPGCAIEIDADLFSQINRGQNRKLVAAVMALGGFDARIKLLDLYCGGGNFSIPAARRGAAVVGVDADALAIAAASANAVRMGLGGARFIAMKAEETARFLARAGYRPDVAILDPPRAGAAELIEPVARLRPAAIIYVACDVATMVRDLAALAAHRYEIRHVRGFDFFPNTHHLEVVAHALLT